ncbi:MAG: metal-dependent hydrolase [Acidimicrobiia bacterium]|nr:metal-dependent hydrolase [Acidimicrobiia bacterium]
MFFWHVGGALFLGRWVFRDPSMDLRFLVLGAVLPDLIDKPIGSVFFTSYFGTGRIYAHTMLFAVAVLFGVMALTSRGSAARKRWMVLPIGVFLHLLLDMPLDAETLWWPALGVEFPSFARGALVDLIAYLLNSPWVVVQELLGLGYLIGLYRTHQLGEPERRRELVETGRLAM